MTPRVDLVLLLLAGCIPPPCPPFPFDLCPWDDDDVDVVDVSDVPPGSDVALLGTVPQDGGEDHDVRAPIQLQWSVAPQELDLRLTIDGQRVDAIVEDRPNATQWVWPEGEEWPADAQVGLRFAWGRDAMILSFRTSRVGIPLADPATLAGTSWALDLATASAVTPAGIEFTWPQAIVPGLLVLDLRANSNPADGLVVARTSWASGIGSNPAEPVPACVGGTTDQKGAPSTFDGREITLAPRDLRIGVAEAESVLYAAELRLLVDPDLGAVGGGVLTGLFDVRPFDLTELGRALNGGACGFLGEQGISCLPCPDGVVACHAVELRGIRGVPIADPGTSPFLWEDDCVARLDLRETTCAAAASAMDPDGDGFFQLCPAFYE
jgi:hypothetical protein